MSLLYPAAAKEVPPELKPVVMKLRRLNSKGDCIKKVHFLLTQKYNGCRFYTYSHFYELFNTGLSSIWKKRGCLHCVTFNYLAKTLLLHSKKFREKDISPAWTLIYYISPHQYLKVKTGKNEFTELDIWGANYGVKIGQHARPLLVKGNFFKRLAKK